MTEDALHVLVERLQQHCIAHGLLAHALADPSVAHVFGSSLGRLLTPSTKVPLTRFEAAAFDELVSRPVSVNGRGVSALEQFMEWVSEPSSQPLSHSDLTLLHAYRDSALGVFSVESAESTEVLLRDALDRRTLRVTGAQSSGLLQGKSLLGRVVEPVGGQPILMPSWLELSDAKAFDLVMLLRWLRDNTRKALRRASDGLGSTDLDRLVAEGVRDAAPLLLALGMRGAPPAVT